MYIWYIYIYIYIYIYMLLENKEPFKLRDQEGHCKISKNIWIRVCSAVS